MAENYQADASQPDSKYFDAEFSKFVDALSERYHVPGLSIAVVDKGSISAKGFGIARYPNVAATPDTLYFTGSTTKAMLAAAAGVLMQKKEDEEDRANLPLQILREHKWETKIKSILAADFELEDEYVTRTITLEDALSHRSGMASRDLAYGSWMGRDPKGIAKALRYLGSLNKLFRTTYQYNNLMYSVVGAVLERVTGLGWGTLLKKLLWDPLKMASTFWEMEQISDAQRQDLARGYFWVENSPTSAKSSGYYVPEPYLDFAGIAPAGAVLSSVNDYAKWLKELLRVAVKEPTSSVGGSVLTHQLFSELTTPRTICPDTFGATSHGQLNLGAYALGWIIRPPVAGVEHPIIEHSGGLSGFRTQLSLLPNDDFGCICVGNAINGDDIGEAICLELIARKLGLSGEAKLRIINMAKAKLPPADSDKASDPAEMEETKPTVDSAEASTPSATDAQVRELLQRVVGDYSHPGFGTFRVSRYKSSEHGQIVYPRNVPQSDRDTRDLGRSRQPCLLVSPVGHRTWASRFLLHTREDSSQTLEVFTSATESAASSNLFFDYEDLGVHGNTKDDVSAGFPTGAEKLDELPENVDLRGVTVWNSQFLSEFGAAIKFDDQKLGDSPSSEVQA